MKMRTCYLFAIRISMWCSAQIQSNQYNGLTSAILIGNLLEIDSASFDIKQEILLFISGD